MRGLKLVPGAAGGAMVDESARAVDGDPCDALERRLHGSGMCRSGLERWLTLTM